MSLQLHRPDGRGGLERRTVRDKDWRSSLQSSRWRAARMPNPEMNPTRSSVAVLFWIGLAVLTFVLLVAGYGTGFWHGA